MIRMLKRCATTAVKLPLAMAWDVISLGNMGEGASTSKVLREHEARKYTDEVFEVVERMAEIKREADRNHDPK